MSEPKNPRCSDCKFFKPPPIAIINGDPGRCGYNPPPTVIRLYAMLHADPGTKIDYAEAFREMPEALRTGTCSEYQPKVQS